MNGREIADPVELGGALWSAPVTDGELLYITSLDHHLHIVDPETMKLAKPSALAARRPAALLLVWRCLCRLVCLDNRICLQALARMKSSPRPVIGFGARLPLR
jgi:hypothetical protein